MWAKLLAVEPGRRASGQRHPGVCVSPGAPLPTLLVSPDLSRSCEVGIRELCLKAWFRHPLRCFWSSVPFSVSSTKSKTKKKKQTNNNKKEGFLIIPYFNHLFIHLSCSDCLPWIISFCMICFLLSSAATSPYSLCGWWNLGELAPAVSCAGGLSALSRAWLTPRGWFTIKLRMREI